MSVTLKWTAEWKKLEKQLESLSDLEAVAGYKQGAATEPGGSDVCTVAAINEFGTDSRPSRPFMRNGISNNIDNIAKDLQTNARQFMSGKGSAEDMLKSVGEVMKKSMIDEAKTGNFAPNENDEGIAGPLQDTGTMLASMESKVRKKGSDAW